MADKTPEPGLVLAGRYRLEEKLGEGGMGTVWRAEHMVLMAPVAVKVLDRDVSRDEEAHDRFIREARSAATLRSPHVVQTLDYGIDDGFPYIVMELLEGETLQQRLSRLGKLTPIETARIITHVARAVARAHEAGIIHRDLKPENVFIVKNEDVEVSKVLDFGVAKTEKAELGPKGTRTRTGSLLGTPFYMSPEQAQGNRTIDPRSDLWALGVIAFECVTGKRPFESDGLGDLVLQICVRPMPVPSAITAVPPRFDEWFSRACHRDLEKRFQTARELSDALKEVVGSEGRETLATLSDDDVSVSGQSVIVRSTTSQEPDSGTANTLATASEDLSIDVEVEPAPASAHKPSFTVRQFGTTQASVPKSSNRTALLLGVGFAALAVGIGAGFIVLGGPGMLWGNAQNTATPATATPSASASTQASAADAEPSESRQEFGTSSESADASASSASEADASAAGSDGGAASRSTDKDKDKDKADKKPRDAGFDRDWGLIKEEEPDKPNDPYPPGSAQP